MTYFYLYKVQRQCVLIHTTTWVNPEKLRLRVRSQA